jgi:outer membrane immunogenic protein
MVTGYAPVTIRGLNVKKTLLATTAIAVLFVIPAQAADMPVKAPPRAAVTTSWEGFYVGAYVGYGYAVTGLDVPGLQLGQIVGAGSKGWVAGGIGGYNKMLAPRWVGGIEVDGGWQKIKTQVDFFGNTAQLKGWSDWSASVRARLGYLVTPTMMLYGSAGWTWSELNLSITGQGFFEQHSASVSGPQVGFGVETMWTDNWIVRTEYLHSFYDKATFNTGAFFFGNPIPVSFSPWTGVVRSALIYKPGSSTQTPWPDRPVTPIWAGFYVGGMVGPLMANAKLSAPQAGLTVNGGGVSAVVPTAMAGYNIMLAPRWLAGIEAEIAPNISTSDVKIEWTGAARGRVGYLLTPTVLTYGTVGWGTAGVKDFTFNNAGLAILVPIERIHALGVGGGVEAALTDRWRLRADYQYYVTNTIDVVLPGNLATTVKATSQTARLGAIYQLSGP